MKRLLLSITFLLSCGGALARELVKVEHCELPVIITAPHGGRSNVTGCGLRTPIGSRFVTSADFNTDVLARGIAKELARLTGKKPYVVMAQFHRKFIDANRIADEAYGSAGCEADNEHYHSVIRGFVEDARAKYQHAMLFDVHGQSAFGDSVLRCTFHGATVTRLLARAGPPAITGPDCVFGLFVAMGYAIVPALDKSPPDRVQARNYSVGHTVDLYGSHRTEG